MSDEIPGAGGNGSDQQAAVQIGILAQYIKDLSFENPNAPQSLQNLQQQQPKIDLSVNVGARKLNDEAYEVDLKISASANQGETSAFLIELVYSGVFGLRNLPAEALEPFLLIECPRLLFPFARRIVADATRDGGFPPLMLDPIDFSVLYRQYLDQRDQQPIANA